MSPRQVRTLVRAVHLVVAVVGAFCVYAPVISAHTARMVWAFALIPLLVISGLTLWKQAALRKLFGRSGRSAAAPSAASSTETRIGR